MSTEAGHPWSIVLAGGEGERTRAFVENWLGYHRPKQYCTFVGTRSLFQHTVDRADTLSSPRRRVVVAAKAHRALLVEQLREREESQGKVILQPRNRGTAAGVFVALAYIFARDSEATVVVYPSDHFVYPEGAFVNTVRNAVCTARRYPDGPVLIGVRPDSSEPDYGWIVPSPAERIGRARRVDTFIEKPDRSVAEEVRRRGALWNTLVVASKLNTLWGLGWRHVPEIMPAFVRFWDALRHGREDTVLEEIYRSLPSRDFSSDVLQRSSRRLSVLEMNGVQWSDWGRPERILETLRSLESRRSRTLLRRTAAGQAAGQRAATSS